jgi:hypothetical protein
MDPLDGEARREDAGEEVADILAVRCRSMAASEIGLLGRLGVTLRYGFCEDPGLDAEAW